MFRGKELETSGESKVMIGWWPRLPAFFGLRFTIHNLFIHLQGPNPSVFSLTKKIRNLKENKNYNSKEEDLQEEDQ